MRERGYNLDWTANLEPEDTRAQDPWISLETMQPDKYRPSGRLSAYKGTRYDIYTVYLPRRGVDLSTPVKAYASGHFKLMECNGRLYLTQFDGRVFERPKTKCTWYVK